MTFIGVISGWVSGSDLVEDFLPYNGPMPLSVRAEAVLASLYPKSVTC